jgi:formyl-CoA transferase
LKLAAEAEVPASRIFSAADMFTDPQYLAREMLLSARLPDGNSIRVPGIVPKMSATPGEMKWTGSKLGEHTNLVLEQLGYSQIEIDHLRNVNAI